MKEIKKALFVKGGQGGGYTIRLPIPKEYADQIGITKDSPEFSIKLEGNKIIVEKERNTMKALALYEVTKHEEMTIDIRQLSDENKEILIQDANHSYNTLSESDKKKTLFEVRIIDIIPDEDEEQSDRLNKLFEKAGLKGYTENYNAGGYDVVCGIGTETMTKKERFEEMGKENGYITFDGKEYALKEAAYADTYGDKEMTPCYKAMAIDTEGKEYMVYWDITDDEAELEEHKCNWSAPATVEAL